MHEGEPAVDARPPSGSSSTRLTAFTRFAEERTGRTFDDYADALAVVDDRARGVLAGGLGLLRRPLVGAAHRRARRPQHARGALVPRRPAELRRARAAQERPGRAGAAVRRARRHAAARAALGGVHPAGARGRHPPARPRASARATGWSPTCPTCPRRWSPWWRRRASARSGPASRPTSAPGVPSTGSGSSTPTVLFAADGYRYGGRDFDRRGRGRRPRRRPAEPARGRATSRCSGSRRPGHRGPTSLRRADGAGGGVRLRAGALRPPAVGAVLLRHDRACPRRSCTGTAASCSSSSSCRPSTSTCARATGRSSSPPPAG